MTDDREATSESANPNDGSSAETSAEAAASGAAGGGDGYVYEPDDAGSRPHQAPPSESDFGWRGWLLVGLLVLSLIVIPTVIIYLPEAEAFIESLGLSLRDTYLVLPLIPAFILGAVAVWAAIQSRT